jgi:hypothetical protein
MQLTRAPRVNYFGESAALSSSFFKFGQEVFDIADISVSGAKLVLKDSAMLYVGHELKGLIHFRNHFVSRVGIKVKHVTKSAAGIEFVSPTDRLRRLIQAYFRTELAGACLSRDKNIPARWVSSLSGDEIELGFEDGRLSLISIALDSIRCRWFWSSYSGDDRLSDLSPDMPEDTLLRVIRNLPQISAEDRLSVEEKLFSREIADA